MLKGKYLVVLVLLTLPFLLVSGPARGQGFVTQTLTTILSNTQVNTATQGSVVTGNTSLARSIFAYPFTLPATHGVCGTYFEQPFNATSGTELLGSFTADGKVDLYVLTDSAYKDWTHKIVAGGNCTPTSLLLQKGTTSYNFTLQVPADGLYQIVVNNLSHSTVNGHLTVSILASAPVTSTIEAYSTYTQSNVQTLTLITLEQTAPQGSDNSILIIGALVVVVIIVVAVLLRAKRAKVQKE